MLNEQANSLVFRQNIGDFFERERGRTQHRCYSIGNTNTM